MAAFKDTFIFVFFTFAIVFSLVLSQSCDELTKSLCKYDGPLSVDDDCILKTPQRWTKLKSITEFVSHWDSNIQLEILPTGQLSAANTKTVIEIYKIDKENNSCKLNFDVEVYHTSTNGEFSFIFLKKTNLPFPNIGTILELSSLKVVLIYIFIKYVSFQRVIDTLRIYLQQKYMRL